MRKALLGSREIDFRALQNRILEYAVEKGFFEDLRALDNQLKIDFLLLLSTRNLVPRREPLDIDETITLNRILFLNWLLLEREFLDGKTIGEMYVEDGAFEEDFGFTGEGLGGEMRGLRSPLCDVFVVVERRERNDGCIVRPVEGGENLFIHDGTLQAEAGDAFYGVLYRFGERCYIGGRGVLKIPDKEMKRYYGTKALLESLKGEFAGFMETKSGLSERTLRDKEEMFTWLLDYVREKGYTRLAQIEKMNVGTWMRWMRRSVLPFSGTRGEMVRRGFGQFHGYLFGRT